MVASSPAAMLGKYELVRRIGQGGMSEVFLARARSIGGFERLVVIKRLLPKLAADAAFVRMFLDEARIAAQLHHGNIVQVHDVDSADGAVFYAMEYLRGHDLHHISAALRASARPFPLDQAIAIALASCAGLHYAHQLTDAGGELLGLVHRDVSPHNIVVTFDGGVKIIDFGIAKIAGARTETQSGTVRGKVRYMSPEQVLAQPLDGRSDIFATAIVLYELVTGVRLFDLGDYDALHAIVYTDAAPASSVMPGVPRELERILARGLARDRAARYPSALEMQLELQTLARERGLDVSGLALAHFMASVFPEEASQTTRPVLETLRVDTGLWALGAEDESDLGLDGETTAAARPGALETHTLPQPAPATARRRWPLVIAGLCAVAAVAAIAWWQLAPAARPPAAAIVAPAAPPPPPAKPAPVTAAPASPASPAPIVEAHPAAAPPRTRATATVTAGKRKPSKPAPVPAPEKPAPPRAHDPDELMPY